VNVQRKASQHSRSTVDRKEGKPELFRQGRGKSGPRKSRLSLSYRRASSVRFVLREPEFEAGDADSFPKALFLWQEFAHQRFWYFGSSHIFVHCFVPLSCSQWQ
jgi:hypothetical protein